MERTIKRQSNFELLRSISMFMILVIHANFVALPHISYDDYVLNTDTSIIRLFIEALGIVAVNVFVFISGWFGVKTTKKSVLSFLYMVFFWLIGGGGVISIILGYKVTLTGVMEMFFLTDKDWFIKSYLVLMVIAPVLNTYTKNTDEPIQRIVVFSFIIFEVIYCWIAGGRRLFADGFGPLHFIGLYLLANYIHKQLGASTTPPLVKRIFSMSKWMDLSIFFLSVAANTLFAVFCISFFKRQVPSFWFAYNSPFIIVGSLFIFLFFSKLAITSNKYINIIGASSFAAFLLHYGVTAVREQLFFPQIQFVYNSYSGIKCIGLVLLFLCLLFICAILIDQLRILSWTRIMHLLKKPEQ